MKKEYLYLLGFMLISLTILAEMNGFHTITGLFIWAWGINSFFKVIISLLVITLGILLSMLIRVLVRALRNDKTDDPNREIYKKVK